MSEFVSKVDKEARSKAAETLKKRFLTLLDQLEKGEPLVMEIPKRTLLTPCMTKRGSFSFWGRRR